jgi:hypothetical protein
MLKPRYAAAAVILAAGISAIVLTTDRPSNQGNYVPRSNTVAATPPSSDENSNSITSTQDCCGGGKTAAADPAEIERRGTEEARKAALLNKFDNWAERYARANTGKRSEMLSEGVALARERRQVMTGLIKTNPKEALEIADRLSPLARQELPAEVAGDIEKVVSARGDLEVLGVTTKEGNSYRRYAQIGNERYAAFTFGSRSAPIPESGTPLLGISLTSTETIKVDSGEVTKSENLLALRPDKFRVLSNAETALIHQNETTPVQHHCPVSGDETNTNGNETAVDVGGEIVWLCKEGHVGPYVQDANGKMVAAEVAKAYAGGPGEGAGSFPSIPAGWSTGSKRLIAMPIRFPEQASNPFGSTNINGAVAESCSRFNNWSYGRVNFTYTLTGILTLPRSMSSYASSGGEDAMMSDAINIANGQGYNASGADFRTVYFTGSFGNYCGLGQIVGRHSWVKCIDAPVTTHEVGHNLGLPHANSWTPSTSNPFGAGSHCEYCGTYNTMGQGGAAYDTMMRFYLRWLTYNEAVDVSAPGTYRIYDPEVTSLTGGRKHTIRIAKQGGQYYFAEFRPRATALSGGGSVDGNVQNGIRILRTDGSEQMDITPGSGGGMWDAALTVGQSLTDAAAGISFSVVAKGGSGTDQFVDVAVSYTIPQLYSGGVYELQPQCAPGLALDVSGSQDVNGANVQIWQSNGGNAQQWKLESQSGGQWELIPLCATGRRLDVNGAGSANGTNVQIYQDSNNTGQRWAISSMGNGYFELTPQCATGSRLDVNGGGNTNGTNVHIWGTNNSPAQRWRLLTTPPNNGAIYELEPQCAPGKRLDVSSSQDVNGANVQSWTVNHSSAQQWRFEDQGNGWFELIPQCATSRRLDVAGAGTADFTNIQIWQDFSNDAQRWSVVGYGNGYFELVPQCSTGSRADVNGSGTTDGTNVQIYHSNNSAAQRWRLYRQ